MGSASSGNKRDKLIRDALLIAVNRVQEGDPQGRKKLAIAAAAVVEKAVEGDLAAFREIADRIDGKAPQSVDVTTIHERAASELSDLELERIIAEKNQAVRPH
ncbi:MAG: hypothetical protein ACK52K_15715 [Alphaproteobacteria bacterium]|jgi:hypothetical protein